MGRYWVDLAPTDVNGPIDLVQLVPISGHPIKVISLILACLTDLTEDEVLCLTFIRGHTTVGSGGSTPTPTPNTSHDRASNFTASAYNTVIASGGTPVIGPRIPFNPARGIDRPLLLEESFGANSLDGTMVLRIIDAVTGTAPLDTLTLFGSILVGED